MKHLFTLFSSFVALFSYATAWATESSQIQISSDKEAYFIGEKIQITIELTNTGSSKLTFCKIWLPSFNLLFDITVDGKKVNMAEVKYDLAPPTENSYKVLKPKESFKHTITLSDYVSFKEKGVYSIVLNYRNQFNTYLDSRKNKYIKVKALMTPIKSNSLKVEIK